MWTHGIYSVILLVFSNIFMTFAWYGHLKMREEFSWFAALPLIGVIAFSWAIAFFEYCLQVPANRLGFKDSGGAFRHHAAESDSGSGHAGRFHRIFNDCLQVRVEMEPSRRICLSGAGGVFCVQEIKVRAKLPRSVIHFANAAYLTLHFIRVGRIFLLAQPFLPTDGILRLSLADIFIKIAFTLRT